MLDKEKWEQLTDEQKLQVCDSVNQGVNINNITKSDWKLMFDFLLSKVQGKQ